MKKLLALLVAMSITGCGGSTPTTAPVPKADDAKQVTPKPAGKPAVGRKGDGKEGE